MGVENLIQELITEIKNIDEFRMTQSEFPGKIGPFEFYLDTQTGEFQSTYFPGKKSGELVELYFDSKYGVGFSTTSANHIGSLVSPKALKRIQRSTDVFERCYIFRKTPKQEAEELLEEMKDYNIMKRNYKTLKSIFDGSSTCQGIGLGVNDCTGEFTSDESGNNFEMEIEKNHDEGTIYRFNKTKINNLKLSPRAEKNFFGSIFMFMCY